ncbi:glycosyl hydrolase family 95 catalytic domain-containing protein [Microbacterium cremeum]|uniref:glycoside hydrolase family 95 protein n=1 Tax=Microbacterium cremeum TaxID=2782169 RepID=UPI00188981B2|nr:glycoside hydrolase family 95 protein [Microbacterium cremeum]
MSDPLSAASVHELRYDSPASEWNEALPLGNGSLGAMCFGDLTAARLQINDETAWSGSPASEYDEPRISAGEARRTLDESRRAVAEGRYTDAETAVKRLQHRHSQAYQPFVDLVVRVTTHDGTSATGYRRRLDLRTATHTASGRVGEVHIAHETWVSAAHGVLVHRVTASTHVDVSIDLATPLRELGREVLVDGAAESSVHVLLPRDVAPPHEAAADPVVYSDDPAAALRGAAVVGVAADGGHPTHAGGRLAVERTRDVVVVLATATTFTGLGRMPAGDALSAGEDARRRVREALATGIGSVRERHLRDHAALYDRASMESADAPGDDDTARRLTSIAEEDGIHPERDPALSALLFNYGRYLLISSSRGSLPATLQGIWNAETRPPWSSNYTTNINLQMNYWPVDVANLAETGRPYADLIAHLAEKGRETAARVYGAPGWVAHHNTDAWGYTQSVGGGTHDAKSAFWPLGGLWLVRQLVDRAEFGARRRTLTELFPLLRSSAEFALSWLQRGEDGLWGTAPSTSPENEFVAPDGDIASVASTSTMDLVLIGDHLRDLCAAAEVAGEADDPVVVTARQVLEELPGIPIGADGAITEWRGDHPQADRHHRHLSPLVFLYPGSRPIPAHLIEPARRLLDSRGDDGTGWSLVWKMALRARLREPDAVERLARLMFRPVTGGRGHWSGGGLYPNLLCAHPPFQIDGNLGWVAAVIECVVQSHDGFLDLLPAVPRSFGDARLRGVVARPGIEVDLEWRFSGATPEVRSAGFRALSPDALGRHRVRTPHGECEIDLREVAVTVALPREAHRVQDA